MRISMNKTCPKDTVLPYEQDPTRGRSSTPTSNVSLAHLWVDFRIISTGQPLPSKIWVLEKALTHHAAKHQIFWWHSCSDVSKSVSNYCVISFEWLHRYISWCYDSITSDGNVMADHCEDGVNDYDGDDSDNSGDYCDIDYHYHYNYNYYYH